MKSINSRNPPKPRPPREHYMWDGKKYFTAPPDEAARLVAEDKAQDLTLRPASALELKRRYQFSGYQRQSGKMPDTAQTEPAPAPAEPETFDPKVAKAPLKHWLSYRTMVADELDKPFNRVTKSEVEAWWKSKGMV